MNGTGITGIGSLLAELAHVARGGVVQVRLEIDAGFQRSRRAAQALGDGFGVLRIGDRTHQAPVRSGHRLIDRAVQKAHVHRDARSLAQPLVQLDRLDDRHLLGERAEHGAWCGAESRIRASIHST